MSHNINNTNQQWQQPANSNQQQIQPVNFQAAPTTSPPGGGNYQQSQQSYSWANGNTQGQHHQSQQSWSWQGQTTIPMVQTQTPMIQSPPILSSPSMLQNKSHHQLHQQMHQNAMAHSQQALAHHQQVVNMQQNMASNMASMMSNIIPAIVQQTPQQPQIAWQTNSPQLQIANQQSVQQQQQQRQIAYQPASPQGQILQQGIQQQQPQVAYQNVTSTMLPQQPFQSNVQQQQQRLAMASSTNVQPQSPHPQSIYQQPQTYTSPASQLSQAASTGAGAPWPHYSIQQVLQQASNVQPSQIQELTHGSPQPMHQDDRFNALDKQRKKDVEDMNRTGAQISQRLRDLENFNARAQSDQEAKDREVRRLQEQLAAVNRQRLQDAERNSRQLAELVRAQAASPAAQTPAFDMSALQKVIQETQARQLSAADIERVIEEQVSKRLSGMATKADIQSAGAQMQNALSQVPAGLNEQQVQQAVNRELNNVMQGVTDRVNRQRYLTGQNSQDAQVGQSPQGHVQTDFVIEELPDDNDDIIVHRASGRDPTLHVAGSAAKVQGMTSALPIDEVHQLASQTSPDVGRSSQRLQMPDHPTSGYSPSGASAASPITIAHEYQSFSGHGPAARLRPRELEAPFTQQATPQNSLTAAKPGTQAQLALGRPQQVALEAPPSTMALANRSIGPSSMSPVPDQSMPRSAYTPQQIQAPMLQRQLEAAPDSSQHLDLTTRSGNAHNQGAAQAGTQQRQIQPAAPHRQLEAAPGPGPQLQVTMPVDLHNQAAAQFAPRPRQIEANAPQRQLEAPTTHSSGASTTGQELVHQSRDVARNTLRR